MPFEMYEYSECLICHKCGNKLVPIHTAVSQLKKKPAIKKKCEFCGAIFDLKPSLPNYEQMSDQRKDYKERFVVPEEQP